MAVVVSKYKYNNISWYNEDFLYTSFDTQQIKFYYDTI